jgi:O-antigen/teichoic acid export membrane protein
MRLLQALPRLAAPLKAVARSSLGANILALYTVQGLNYLLPLIVLPYLLRVLGPGNYGAIVFAQALVGYLIILTDFGFNFSATREVSIARDNPAQLARIFWTTLLCKALLLTAGAVVIWPVILAVPALARHSELIGISGLLVVGNVLLPQWYFQGLEQMRMLAIGQVAAKALGVLATFALVRSPRDELIAGAVLSMPAVLAGLICLLSVRFIAPVRWYRPRLPDVKGALASAWPLFLSGAVTSLYVTSNAFLLGLISGDTAVALYGVGNKVTQAAFNLFTPVLQAIYPRASRVFGRSVEEGRALLRQMAAWLAAPAGLLSVAVIAAAPFIVRVLGGQQYAAAVPVLRIMGPLPLVLTLATLFQTAMIHLGLTRALLRIYIFAAVLSLILLPLLASRFEATGAAMSLLTVETVGALMMLRTIRMASSR